MKKYLILLAIIILFSPGFILSDLVTFKFGFFIPRAESDLWEVEFENMDFDKGSFQGTDFVFDYEYFLSKNIGLVLSLGNYSKKKNGFYLDYILDPDVNFAFDYGEGFEIGHTYSVSFTPVQISLKLAPLGRRGKFIPYLGGGVGLYLWSVSIVGYVIDFEAAELFYDPNIDEDVIGFEVFESHLSEDNKISFGYHVFAGIMVPIGNRISLDAGFKYNFVEGKLTDSFEGFEPFDLSGYQISFGIDYWF
ncbi:hypothetical protein ACFLRM_03610 [Acidobacteriota bacterium]